MHVSSFLKLVEIQTKAASVIPFLMGTGYVLYHFHRFNYVNFLLMFGSLMFIDMTTTALNNYFDFKRAYKRHGYNYESHNSITRDKLNEKTVLPVILVMLSAAVILGIQLVLNTDTDIVVLLLGVLSFGAGIFYSFGPVPISRTPLGEVFSGFFMGFIIVFLSVYIHIYDSGMVMLTLDKTRMLINIEIYEIACIFLLALPVMLGISNIMLANNICDIEDDIENKRFTLPICIGRDKALSLYRFLYYIAYADIIVLCILKILPPVCLVTLFSLLPVMKNIKKFCLLQTKKDTFALSVKNLFILNIPQIILIFAVYGLAG